jgi:tetratricopeptide (TPR) repeat protein
MKRIISLVFCVIFTLSMLVSCSGAEKTLSAAELLNLGEKYLLEMNYEQALVQFLAVIEIEPMNQRGYTGAAQAYVGLGKIDEAVAVLEQGLERLPEEVSILEALERLGTESKVSPEPIDEHATMQDDEDLSYYFDANILTLDEITLKSRSPWELSIDDIMLLFPGGEIETTSDHYLHRPALSYVFINKDVDDLFLSSPLSSQKMKNIYAGWI